MAAIIAMGFLKVARLFSANGAHWRILKVDVARITPVKFVEFVPFVIALDVFRL
jgi:hypothetical protein